MEANMGWGWAVSPKAVGVARRVELLEAKQGTGLGGSRRGAEADPGLCKAKRAEACAG